MKAVVVFDVDSDFDFDQKLWVQIEEYLDGEILESGCHSVKPLPCKKYMRQMPSNVLEMGKRKRDFIIQKVDVDNSYVEGWNACLDAILGETE